MTATTAVIATIVAVGATYVLTEYGITKGLPAPVSFVIVLAALFGILAVKLRA